MEIALQKKEEKKDRFDGMMVAFLRKKRNGYYTKKGTVIRKPERARKGIMMAIPIDDNTVHIGWALCNFSENDTFDLDFGAKVAVNRALTCSTVHPAESMVAPITKFVLRARKYYKDKVIRLSFPLALGEFPPDRIEYDPQEKDLIEAGAE